MADPSGPQHGDVVVREDIRNGQPVYVLYTVPGADQVCVRVREQAFAQAVGFAKRERVRAWFTEGSSVFGLLQDFTVVEPV